MHPTSQKIKMAVQVKTSFYCVCKRVPVSFILGGFLLVILTRTLLSILRHHPIATTLLQYPYGPHKESSLHSNMHYRVFNSLWNRRVIYWYWVWFFFHFHIYFLFYVQQVCIKIPIFFHPLPCSIFNNTFHQCFYFFYYIF